MCTEGVCEGTTEEESYEQTCSNSVKWNFKNKPRASQQQFALGLLSIRFPFF